MSRHLTAILLAVFAVHAGASQAQDLTDDELLGLFQAQRDAFRAAAESPLGATRGLTLVTVDDVGPAASVAADPAPQIGEAPATASAATGGEASPGVSISGDTAPVTAEAGGLRPLADEVEAAPVVFGKLDPEMQVNVHITFDFDSAALRSDQAPKLAQICSVMKSSDIALFRVAGHTDAAGPADYNERLSRLRAEEVQRYLVDTCGIAPARVEAIGLGKRFLFNEDDPRAEENRRVEFQALS
jgi:OmpA-OmpF porin, OOP family